MFSEKSRERRSEITRFVCRSPVFLLALAVLILGAAVPDGWTGEHNVEEFDDAQVFFEFNSTDLDLGIHLFFDAIGWEKVKVNGPNGTTFSVKNGGSLKQIGSTEVFTESAEPLLDEDNLDDSIEAFQAMFPEGIYTFEGKAVDGRRLEGEAMLTHALPAAPQLIFPDPEAEENVADPENTVIEWSISEDEGPEIVRYHVVVEFEEEETERVFEFSVDILADSEAETQSVKVPPEFFASLAELEGEFKAEVVAIAASRNATISENEFELEE